MSRLHDDNHLQQHHHCCICNNNSNNNKSHVCCAPVRDASLSLPLRPCLLSRLSALGDGGDAAGKCFAQNALQCCELSSQPAAPQPRAILARVAAPDRDVGRRRGFSESCQEGVRHHARHRVCLPGEPVRRDHGHETWVRIVGVGCCAQWRWRLCSPLPRMGHRREIGGSRNAARTPIPVGRVVAVRCHQDRFYDLVILLPSDGMGEAENMVCAPVAAPRSRLPA